MTIHEKIALWLIALSWLVCATILLLPFVPSGDNKLLRAAVIYFVSQIIFWAGCALGGKEVVRRYQLMVPIKDWLIRILKGERRG